MKKIFIFLIVVILIYLIFSNFAHVSRAGDCGKSFLVLDREIQDDENKQANKFCILNKKATILINHLSKKYPELEMTKKLVNKYNYSDLIEHGSETFTINKGERIHMCLKSDINTLTYVLVHELAHIGSVTVGHGEQEFWRKFKFLLKIAVELNLYRPVNYLIYPVKYCGSTINNSILYS